MKKKIENLIKGLNQNLILKGSLILIAGTTVGNFMNYLYHFFMGRMLGPADYGVLSSLISLIYLQGIPVGFLSLVVVKYVSGLKEKKGLEAAYDFYQWLLHRLVVWGVLGFIVLVILSPLIANFLHLDSLLLVLVVNIVSLVSIFFNLDFSTIQGFLHFGVISKLSIAQSLVKLVLGFILVYLGLKTFGAIFSLLLSVILAYVLSSFYLKNLFKFKKKVNQKKKESFSFSEILRYSILVFFSNLALTSFYTNDVLLARHFLPAVEAGYYASISVIGKIVFFASSSISQVMFPVVSGKFAQNKNHQQDFLSGFFIVLGISLGLSAIYFSFPNLLISLLFGKDYLKIAPYLGKFSIFMVFYSLVFLTNAYYLAINQRKMILVSFFGAILQILAISFYHASVNQIIFVNILILSLTLVALLSFFFKENLFHLSLGKNKGKIMMWKEKFLRTRLF